MSRRRVYIDSCILIHASKNSDEAKRDIAIAELNLDVDYLTSSIVELETIPATVRNGYKDQEAFLRAFFDEADHVECSESVQRRAIAESAKAGAVLRPMDALHVACAICGGADEFVTAEKDSRLPSISALAGIKIRSVKF